MKQGSPVSGSGIGVVSSRRPTYEPGALVFGEIATDEVLRPGQRIQLWMIVTNVGDCSVSESVRMRLMRADANDCPLAVERNLDMTVPPGEMRVATFDLALDEIAGMELLGLSATAVAGDFEITVATPTDGGCRRARVRLAADHVSELVAVA